METERRMGIFYYFDPVSDGIFSGCRKLRRAIICSATHPELAGGV
jgi:hypothetical protein